MNELYQRYVEAYSDRPAYIEGRSTISERDLLNKLGAEVDMLTDEYGTLNEYAEPDEPEMLMELYSISEAEELIKDLRDLLG